MVSVVVGGIGVVTCDVGDDGAVPVDDNSAAAVRVARGEGDCVPCGN